MKDLKFIIIIFILLSCSPQSNKSKSNTSNSKNFIDYTPKRVKTTDKKFNEVFSKVSKIVLKVDEKHLISQIKKIIFHNSKFIVVDALGKQLLVFNKYGKYENSIGKIGSGPGEFKQLTDIAVNSKNEILLLDNENMRVSYFNIDGKFIKSFKIYSGFDICASNRGGFYLYNPTEYGKAVGKVIDYYSSKGKFVRSFCSPFFKIGGLGANFEIDNYGNLYLIHPSVYKIIKYNTVNYTFKVIGSISNYYRPLKISKNRLPTLDELDRSTHPKTILVNSNYILLEIIRGKPRAKWIDIYNSNGNIIYSGINVNPDLSLGDIDKNNYVYFIKNPTLKKHSNLFELQDYEILTYKLRGNKI